MRCPSGSLASPAVEWERAHGEQVGTPAGELPESPLFLRTLCQCLPGRPHSRRGLLAPVHSPGPGSDDTFFFRDTLHAHC